MAVANAQSSVIRCESLPLETAHSAPEDELDIIGGSGARRSLRRHGLIMELTT